jgi:CorA-like Mg2+ transporter protein
LNQNSLAYSTTFKEPFSAQYFRSLKNFSPADVRAADAIPADFLWPYARLLAAHYSALLQDYSCREDLVYSKSGRDKKDQKIDFTLGKWAQLLKRITDAQKRLELSYKNMSTFISCSPKSAAGRQVTSLLEDYRDLLSAAKELKDDTKAILDREVSRLALEESRKSIEAANLSIELSKESIKLADGVKRLTQLAFFFIPLSFVTSFFGMNMRELNADQISLWMFFVTAIGLTIIVLLLWTIVDGRLPIFRESVTKFSQPRKYFIPEKVANRCGYVWDPSERDESKKRWVKYDKSLGAMGNSTDDPYDLPRHQLESLYKSYQTLDLSNDSTIPKSESARQRRS